jgi:hypothetical protein
LQSFEKLPGVQAERGNESGSETGDERDGDDDGQSPPVEVNLLRACNVDLRVLEPGKRSPGEQQAKSASGDGED